MLTNLQHYFNFINKLIYITHVAKVAIILYCCSVCSYIFHTLLHYISVREGGYLIMFFRPQTPLVNFEPDCYVIWDNTLESRTFSATKKIVTFSGI